MPSTDVTSPTGRCVKSPPALRTSESRLLRRRVSSPTCRWRNRLDGQAHDTPPVGAVMSDLDGGVGLIGRFSACLRRCSPVSARHFRQARGDESVAFGGSVLVPHRSLGC